jgi:hypothetical protein
MKDHAQWLAILTTDVVALLLEHGGHPLSTSERSRIWGGYYKSSNGALLLSDHWAKRRERRVIHSQRLPVETKCASSDPRGSKSGREARHSFNGIADSTECLLSLQKLNRVIALDQTRNKVTTKPESGMGSCANIFTATARTRIDCYLKRNPQISTVAQHGDSIIGTRYS